MKRMIVIFLSVCVPTSQIAKGTDWQVVHLGISSNPGRMTNNSARFYWDSSSDAYYQNKISDNEYAYKPLPSPYAAGQWHPQYDIKPVSIDWAANAICTIYSDMNIAYKPVYLNLNFCQVNQVYVPPLDWTDSGNNRVTYTSLGISFR